MNTDTRSTSGLLRSSTALGAATLLLGSLALGACSKTDAPGTSRSVSGGASIQDSATDSDTVDLVNAALETPATADPALAGPDGNRKRLRAKLLHALHATWVTDGAKGPVTHQAIRGEVTAVSGTSITVKAKDGFSLTFSVTKHTTVRQRAKGKGADSSIGAVKVGSKALVTGVGATSPTARFVAFRGATPPPSGSPSPSATS